MQDVAILSFLLRCAYASAAVLLLYGLNRLWNKLSGNKFDEAYARIVAEPHAAALYHGIRFLAFAFLVGSVLS